MKHCAICGEEIDGAAAVCHKACADQATLLDMALELACIDCCDECCPKDFYDEIDWEECETCIVGPNKQEPEMRYDIQRDQKCWKRYYLEKATKPHCRVCGCTDDRACPGGCYWVEPDLCSRCAAEGEPRKA